MKKNIIIILSLIAFFTVIGHFLSNTYFFKHLELLSYDLRSKFNTDNGLTGKNLKHADKDIVIVAIDNYSQRKLIEAKGKNDWETGVWKNLVNFIEKGEPKVVMFDMVFEKAQDEPWYNRTFASTLSRYDNIVMGTYLDNPLVHDNNFTKKIDIAQNDFIPTNSSLDVSINDKKLDKEITYTTNAPVSNLYTKYNTMGVVNSVLDDDSVVRKDQPVYKLTKDGESYYMPSLAFAGFLKYMGEGEQIQIKDKKIHYKGRVIPIDDDGVVNIGWHKMGRSYTYIPISKIILNEENEEEISPEFFKDKIVIIGKTATGSRVDLSSIIDSTYAGPEAVAVALDNFINDSNPYDHASRKFISEVPKSVKFLIIVAACLIVALVGLIPSSAFMGFLNGFIAIILYISFSFWMFINPASRVWLPMVEPLYYLTVTAGVVFAFRFYNEMTKKASIMNVFGKFVSPKVLSSVLKDPKKMVLKNTRKKISVLFCDVKNFTSISEKTTPEFLIENLNELFKEIVNIIFENNGTVDKFIGDCIMAYWGDLDESDNHAYMAVKTALEIQDKVKMLKELSQINGKIPFDVKIGIATGDAVLGLAGTDKIMSYTAMGDAVNVAARLESSCSTLHRDILISKATYEQSKSKIKVLEVGKIRIKGKDDRIEVYEPTALLEAEEKQKTVALK